MEESHRISLIGKGVVVKKIMKKQHGVNIMAVKVQIMWLWTLPGRRLCKKTVECVACLLGRWNGSRGTDKKRMKKQHGVNIMAVEVQIGWLWTWPGRRSSSSSNLERSPSMKRKLPEKAVDHISATKDTMDSVKLTTEFLVGKLAMCSIDIQRQATYELRLLAKTGMDNKRIILEAGAIPFLVTLLFSHDPRIQENAVTTLLKLSIFDNNKVLIVAAGAINSIVEVDSCVFPIFVPLYTGGVLEKDSAPYLTARQEQTVKLLESHKASFRRYLECFLCLVGLSPYNPFDENSYPAFERPDRMDMGLLDFIKTADLRKVWAVEVQKGDDQVTLLESTRHCFMPLVIPAAGGSSSVAATKIPAPTKREQEDVTEGNAYLELADLDEGATMVRQSKEEVVTKQPKKIKKKRLIKQSDVLPANKLRMDHPSLASGTGGKTLAGLEQIMLAGSRFSSTLSAPVDIVAATTTSTKAKLVANVNPDLAGPSQLKESEGSDDSFYELATLDPSEAKCWYVPRWNITNDSLLDDGFSCRAVRKICLGSEVRSRAEHELELKEKLNAKYVARGKLLEKKDSEILRLKSQLAEKEAEAAEKDHDISLLDSCATHLESALNDAQVACTEAETKITSLASKRDRLVFEVSSLRAGFKDFKEKMEIQQEEQAQELYNRVAELEAHVMDVSSCLEWEFYPTYLTLLAGRRWLLTHGIQLDILKCLKSSEYQGLLGHALGRAVDFSMQKGLEAGHEHGVAERSLSIVDAYNP
ncbi:U-box domain-containing protein 1-like protein [Tanacetum coccineum]